jgi:hypothetical protein
MKLWIKVAKLQQLQIQNANDISFSLLSNFAPFNCLSGQRTIASVK